MKNLYYKKKLEDLFLMRGRDLVRKQKWALIVLSMAFLVLMLIAMRYGSLQPFSTVNAGPGQPLPQTRNFQLYVRDNTLTMPDGQKIWIFGYSASPQGNAQVPGPTLIVNQDDTVNITLNNTHDPTITGDNPSGDGHTLHLH